MQHSITQTKSTPPCTSWRWVGSSLYSGGRDGELVLLLLVTVLARQPFSLVGRHAALSQFEHGFATREGAGNI